MADKRVSDLPRATALGDNDLLVVEQGGAAKSATVAAIAAAAMPKDALGLIRRVLGKGAYTEDVSALLAALDEALAGGQPDIPPDEPDEPDEPVVPPDEPEVVTEELKTGYNYSNQQNGTTRYPDLTTFEFTPTERTLYDCYMLIYPSTIGGGTLNVNYDVSKCNGFQMMFYLFGPDGNPYKLGQGGGPKPDTTISTVTYLPTVGDNLAGGMSTVDWLKDPGSSPGWTTVAGPFTLAIPDGCNIMIAVQSYGRISADGSVTGTSTLYDLWDSGWLTATITKEV